MKLNRLNKAFLILIALSLVPACRTGDGGVNGNGSGAGMYDYICPNGTPKDGKSQTQNDNKCKECDSGYALDSNEQCVSGHPYECQNGTPGDGLAPTPNTTKCTACNEGYSLENMSCTIPAEPVGMGTKASPYVLLNYAHLKTMGNALNKHYKLGTDIDAREGWSEGAQNCDEYEGDGELPTDTPCTGWVPLGDAATNFTGSLDGNGYIVRNLYTYVKPASGNAYGGLFGYTGGGC